MEGHKRKRAESQSITYLVVRGEKPGVCFLEMCWYADAHMQLVTFKWWGLFINEQTDDI